MIEKIVRDYLVSVMTVPVFVEIPANPPPEFVVIERTGGSMRNQVSSAMVSIRSIGASLYRAIEIDKEVRESMHKGIIARPDIYSAKLNGCANLTDETLRKYRYQSTYDIYYGG
jgi:hypothetical protein